MTSTPAPTDTSREAIERLARMLREDRHPATITKVEGSPCNPLGEKASDALIALLERAEAAEKRTQRDCGEEACPYLVKANLALSVARADAERLRDALQEIEIAEPDADGIVWLKIKLHSGTTIAAPPSHPRSQSHDPRTAFRGDHEGTISHLRLCNLRL